MRLASCAEAMLINLLHKVANSCSRAYRRMQCLLLAGTQQDSPSACVLHDIQYDVQQLIVHVLSTMALAAGWVRSSPRMCIAATLRTPTGAQPMLMASRCVAALCLAAGTMCATPPPCLACTCPMPCESGNVLPTLGTLRNINLKLM